MALRADEGEFAQIQEQEPCATEQEEALNPFTDAPRPQEEQPDEREPAMTYVIQPGVMRTAGKAMAQAGHAALMCVEELEPAHRERFAEWREAGRPGELLTDGWERLRTDPEAVTVSDAGHTQVAPGTETVIALVPSSRGSRRP